MLLRVDVPVSVPMLASACVCGAVALRCQKCGRAGSLSIRFFFLFFWPSEYTQHSKRVEKE